MRRHPGNFGWTTYRVRRAFVSVPGRPLQEQAVFRPERAPLAQLKLLWAVQTGDRKRVDAAQWPEGVAAFAVNGETEQVGREGRWKKKERIRPRVIFLL